MKVLQSATADAGATKATTADAGATKATTADAGATKATTAPVKKKTLSRKDLKEMPEAELVALKAKNQTVIDACHGVLNAPDACQFQEEQNQWIDAILNGEKPTNTAELERKAQTEAFNLAFQSKVNQKHLDKLGETNIAKLKEDGGLTLRAKLSEAGELTFEVIRVKEKSGTASERTAGTGTKSSNPYDGYVVGGVFCATSKEAIEAAKNWLNKNGGVAFREPEGSYSKPRYLADLGKKYPGMEVLAVLDKDSEASTVAVLTDNKISTGTISVGESDKAVTYKTVDLSASYKLFAS